MAQDAVTPLRKTPRLAVVEGSGYVRAARSQLQAGEVALVGAGPGDPELLTVKALSYLQQADVVLYDYLVSDEIMALIPSETILVCVGKRAGHHSVPQEKPINSWSILPVKVIAWCASKAATLLCLAAVGKS